MQRREFITAAVGMTAAVASASQAFAQQDYPDFGAIKKIPVGEGLQSYEKGIEEEAGAAKKASLKRSPRPSGRK